MHVEHNDPRRTKLIADEVFISLFAHVEKTMLTSALDDNQFTKVKKFHEVLQSIREKYRRRLMREMSENKKTARSHLYSRRLGEVLEAGNAKDAFELLGNPADVFASIPKIAYIIEKENLHSFQSLLMFLLNGNRYGNIEQQAVDFKQTTIDLDGNVTLEPTSDVWSADYKIQIYKDEVIRVSEKVPEQNIAPVYFSVRDNKIAVRPATSSVEPGDQQNVDGARRELIEVSARLLPDLIDSNFDRRVAVLFENLHKKLVEEGNAVAIGIAHLPCTAAYAKIKDEMADILAIQVATYLQGVGMLVAQFPDWQRFVENANMVEISPREIEQIKAHAHGLVAKLEAQPEGVEPEVPRSFKALLSLVEDPQAASKRAAYALVTSIENLVKCSWRFGAEFLTNIASETSKTLATYTSRVLVVALLTYVSAGIYGIGPAASANTDSQWMKPVKELAEKYIAELMKGTN
jgi:hypothetical protein